MGTVSVSPVPLRVGVAAWGWRYSYSYFSTARPTQRVARRQGYASVRGLAALSDSPRPIMDADDAMGRSTAARGFVYAPYTSAESPVVGRPSGRSGTRTRRRTIGTVYAMQKKFQR